MTEDEWKQFALVVEGIIVTTPTCCNRLRDVSKYYDVIEAYQLLKGGGLIASYSISEEMITLLTVFSHSGRSALVCGVTSLYNSENPKVAIYTCGIYILLIGCNCREFYTGRLRPEVQILTLLYTILDRKVTLSYTFHRKWYPFHIPTVETLQPFTLHLEC